MVKTILVALFVAGGLAAMPRAAAADPGSGCTTTLADCYEAAAKIDSFWYRWAAGLDCELDYAECVRVKLVGG
jgi:hypothetical protein